MENKTTFESLENIISIAKEMNANDFLLEFGQAVEILDMENLLDPNEGMVNFAIEAKTDEGVQRVALLFIDGSYDCYSY